MNSYNITFIHRETFETTELLELPKHLAQTLLQSIIISYHITTDSTISDSIKAAIDSCEILGTNTPIVFRTKYYQVSIIPAIIYSIDESDPLVFLDYDSDTTH